VLPIEAVLAQELKPLGFRKKSRTWWRESQDTIQILNLQKSAYADQLYVNLRIYIKCLGTEAQAPLNYWHVDARLERIAPVSSWNDIVALTASAAPDDRVVRAIVDEGIAWLDRLSTLDGIKGYISMGGARLGLVSAAAKSI